MLICADLLTCQDKLRSLLGEIELSLKSSYLYEKVVDDLQHLGESGESKEQAQALLELVAREAISLTCRRLICQSHVDAVHTNNHKELIIL